MCGIVGVIGQNLAAPRLLASLKRLEYRGYDSAGIATILGGELGRRRALGNLDHLVSTVDAEPLGGTLGIGHTRWATHGAPTLRNAHPHATPTVAVVHNGIIENFRDLRRELGADGASFESDTDTEVIAHLLTGLRRDGHEPHEAVRIALSRLQGAFALAILFQGEEDLLIGARRGSPLAVGHGDGEMFLGSDALALADLTSRVTFLDDGDIAVLTRAGARIVDCDGTPVDRPLKQISAQTESASKGDYRHFMLKEIHEQPEAITHTLSFYVDPGEQKILLPEGVSFKGLPILTLSGCGTAYYAGLVARYWFERLAHLPVDLDVASEFRYREPRLDPAGLGLFISQSGETADTLAVMRYCRSQDMGTLAVVNVPESTMVREADQVVPTYAGHEIGVASTKAFTCQLSVLAALAIAAGRQRGVLDREAEIRLTGHLMALPGAVAKVLRQEAAFEAIGRAIHLARDVLYLGRGTAYPIALEGALKLKEISYIHAEGYPAGELKHGPIALIDDNVPVVVIAPYDDVRFEKTVSNMEEVAARGGKIILLSDRKGLDAAGAGAWHSVELPEVDPVIAPMVSVVAVQLIAYYTAVAKGTDVDRPRNLAKSVTVE